MHVSKVYIDIDLSLTQGHTTLLTCHDFMQTQVHADDLQNNDRLNFTS